MFYKVKSIDLYKSFSYSFDEVLQFPDKKVFTFFCLSKQRYHNRIKKTYHYGFIFDQYKVYKVGTIKKDNIRLPSQTFAVDRDCNKYYLNDLCELQSTGQDRTTRFYRSLIKILKYAR